ncbi:hypothetical protein SDC9_199659 [bioreactor metagenome]|uniref:Uncharacterized protein n=1 Tax=bioreactor metagenome TaxID=1076179 RepID=A0A645IL66_9ZZZZ
MVGLFEGIEQAVDRFRRNADAGVADFETDQHRRRLGVDDPGAQQDAAVLGEFERVACVVEQRLLQTRAVAAQPAQVGRVFAAQFDALGFGAFLQHRADVLEQAGQGECAAFQLQLAGFDLRQVEHVVDDFQEVTAGRFQLVETGQLLIG